MTSGLQKAAESTALLEDDDARGSPGRLLAPARDKRIRYPSSTNGESAGGHDVDSSTELWDDGEEGACSHCDVSLHTDYTNSLKLQIKEQHATLKELKERVKELEARSIHTIELERQIEEQSRHIKEKTSEVDRLEKLVEEFDSLNQQNDDLKLLLRLKDEEIRLLNKDITKLSDRVSDYNEIEAHNTDLQTELFSRDREVMTLKHSEERLKATYMDLIQKNSQLEDKLLEQDGRHEEQKAKFENSIVKLTNKLIAQRKRSEQLEQENARSVRDCRLAVRLLQCASPASNEHTPHQSNKLTFLFDGANKSISNSDEKPKKRDLRAIKQNSFEDESAAEIKSCDQQENNTRPQLPRSTTTAATPGLRKTQSSSCLESLQCMQPRNGRHYHHNRLLTTDCGCAECSKHESVSVLKDLLQGKKDAIHVLRVELGKRDKEISLLRKKLTVNLSESINATSMEPNERIQNLETRVSYLNDENFNLKYQLEICRKLLDKISGVNPS